MAEAQARQKLREGVSRVTALREVPDHRRAEAEGDAYEAVRTGVLAVRKDEEALDSPQEEEMQEMMRLLVRRGTEKKAQKGRATELLKILLPRRCWLVAAQQQPELLAALHVFLSDSPELLEQLKAPPPPETEPPEPMPVTPRVGDGEDELSVSLRKLQSGLAGMRSFNWEFPHDPVSAKLDTATEAFQDTVDSLTLLSKSWSKGLLASAPADPLVIFQSQWPNLLTFLASMYTSGKRNTYMNRIKFVVGKLRQFSPSFEATLKSWPTELPWGQAAPTTGSLEVPAPSPTPAVGQSGTPPAAAIPVPAAACERTHVGAFPVAGTISPSSQEPLPPPSSCVPHAAPMVTLAPASDPSHSDAASSTPVAPPLWTAAGREDAPHRPEDIGESSLAAATVVPELPAFDPQRPPLDTVVPVRVPPAAVPGTPLPAAAEAEVTEPTELEPSAPPVAEPAPLAAEAAGAPPLPPPACTPDAVPSAPVSSGDCEGAAPATPAPAAPSAFSFCTPSAPLVEDPGADRQRPAREAAVFKPGVVWVDFKSDAFEKSTLALEEGITFQGFHDDPASHDYTPRDDWIGYICAHALDPSSRVAVIIINRKHLECIKIIRDFCKDNGCEPPRFVVCTKKPGDHLEEWGIAPSDVTGGWIHAAAIAMEEVNRIRAMRAGAT